MRRPGCSAPSAGIATSAATRVAREAEPRRRLRRPSRNASRAEHGPQQVVERAEPFEHAAPARARAGRGCRRPRSAGLGVREPRAQALQAQPALGDERARLLGPLGVHVRRRSRWGSRNTRSPRSACWRPAGSAPRSTHQHVEARASSRAANTPSRAPRARRPRSTTSRSSSAVFSQYESTLRRPSRMRTRSSSPSVSAAGPGCRMRALSISWTWPVFTAVIALPPRALAEGVLLDGLAAPRGHDHLGVLRASTSSAVTKRSFAALPCERSANTSSPPAICDQLAHPADARDHRVGPLLEVDARPLRARVARSAASVQPRAVARHERTRASLATHHAARAGGSRRGSPRSSAG